MALGGTSGGFLSTNPTVTAWGTEYTAVNGSGQVLPQTCSMETVVQAWLTFIMALVGLAGNGVVLWLLGFHVRRNAFTVYILNLAGADFLCLCLLIIRSLVLLSNFFLSSSISIPQFLTPVFTFVYIVGLSILSAISTERCLSVLCPIWYRCRRPRHTSAVMCALLWALSLLLSVLRGKYCGFLFSDGDMGWCRVIDFIFAAWLIFLFLLLSGCSLALPTRLLWGSQQVQLTRLYLTIVLTALVFLFCGLPLGIHWFLVFWIQGGFDMFSLHLYLVTMFLSCVNSSTNPIIYFFVGSFRRRQQRRQQRQTLKWVLQRALQDTPEVAESEGSLPQEPLEMSGSSVMS